MGKVGKKAKSSVKSRVGVRGDAVKEKQRLRTCKKFLAKEEIEKISALAKRSSYSQFRSLLSFPLFPQGGLEKLSSGWEGVPTKGGSRLTSST